MFSFISFCVYASDQSLLFAISAKEEFSSLELNMVELEVVEVVVVMMAVLKWLDLELNFIRKIDPLIL